MSTTEDEPTRVRPALRDDFGELQSIGHPPGVAQAFVPSPPRRLGWWLSGHRIVNVVAEDRRSGRIVGSVQFIRSLRDPGTWMFGHWRVVAARRREGIGRHLLRRGFRLLGKASRLYSYVDWGNDVSVEAHLRLGFETASVARGSATLAVLSTIGPAAPSIRLQPVRRSKAGALYPLYAASMGDLWLRLFPGLDRVSFLDSDGDRRRLVTLLRRGLLERPERLWLIDPGEPAGFVRWEASGVELFIDPARCEAGMLSRVALQLLALGAPREERALLRGLPRGFLARPGPVQGRMLMGMIDAARRFSDSPASPSPRAPSSPPG
jgi:RimJ/RimL family protein N-acetyltransferase